MVDYIDSTQNFTITLIGEGLATVTLVKINDIEVYPIANPVSALEGTIITMNIQIRNDGFSDDLFCSITAPGWLGTSFRWYKEAGGISNLSVTATDNLIMPVSNLNITIEAGHEE